MWIFCIIWCIYKLNKLHVNRTQTIEKFSHFFFCRILYVCGLVIFTKMVQILAALIVSVRIFILVENFNVISPFSRS